MDLFRHKRTHMTYVVQPWEQAQHKLLLLTQVMGANYVKQDAFNPKHVMEESSSSTPIFFILFPGYSPSKEVELYANKVSPFNPPPSSQFYFPATHLPYKEVQQCAKQQQAHTSTGLESAHRDRTGQAMECPASPLSLRDLESPLGLI